MTEPTPPPVDAAPPVEDAPAADATSTPPAGDVSSAAPAAGSAAGQTSAGAGWPDVSNTPTEPRCPWCSAVLSSPDLATCPSCGAQLNGPEAELPGVTTIDVAALAWKAGAPPRRNKLMSWISGDADDEPTSSPESLSAIEPPSLAVRREMLRLELEAEGISLPHDAEPATDEAATDETATDETATDETATDAAAGNDQAASEGPGTGSPSS
jgi:hypothetical protein